jgi:exodeoxyribonuclease V
VNALKRILARQAEVEAQRVSTPAASSILEKLRRMAPAAVSAFEAAPPLPPSPPAQLFTESRAKALAGIVGSRSTVFGAPLPVFRQRSRATEPGVRAVDMAITYQDLSSDQKHVYDAVMDWHHAGDELLTVGGFAGTGKSTVLGLLARELTQNKRVAFCAYTGKAASVLRDKLGRQGIQTKRGGFHHSGTIHSLMYRPVVDENETLLDWSRRNSLEYDLIVVDEASMVRVGIFQDLMAYGVPILLVGDHGQLPPVNDGTEADIGLMDEPDVRLDKIHRQAEGSEIITLSRYIRENGDFPADLANGKHVSVVNAHEAQELLAKLYAEEPVESVATLVYANWERKLWNQNARQARGIADPLPVRGDQIICLRNTQGILFNGTRGVIESDPVDRGLWASAKLFFPDDELGAEGWMLKEQFVQERTLHNPTQVEEATGFFPRPFDRAGLLLDYGYALTVHKCQASQMRHVIFIPRVSGRMTESEYARWAYTGATRASERLYVVR